MNNVNLTVDLYNRLEQEKKDYLSNRNIQASCTESFTQLGYPTWATNDGGIWRFGETMHEHSQRWIWEQILTGLTQDECDALKELNHTILPRVSEAFYKPVKAANSFLGPLSVGRHITHMFPNKKLRILEVGAGAGYLSWYLARAGHQVITTDVSQGFYLHQHHLFKAAYGENAVELATENKSFRDCLDDPNNRIIHMPWWQYYGLHENLQGLKVDIIITEANITEMSSLGFLYAINLGLRIIDRDNPFSFMGFRDWGYQENYRNVDVYRDFRRLGFALRHTDNKFNVFAPYTANDVPEIDADLEHMISHYRETYPDWRRLNNLPPRLFESPKPEWKDLILNARAEAESKIVLDGSHFESFAKEELGVDFPGGADQKFSDFCKI